MEADDIVKIATAYAAPLFTFLGILAQVYFANKGSRERKEKEQRQSEKLDTSTETIRKQIEENTGLARENHKLIEQNNANIQILRRELAANNQATIASARSVIKRVYDQLKEDKIITYSDLEMVEELYTAYKNVRLEDGHVPNGYADACMEEMRKWKKVESHHEYKTQRPLDLTQ